MNAAHNLRTEAWLLTGSTVGKMELEIPGWLQLSNGRLRFTVDTNLSETLADVTHGDCLLNVALSEIVNITFPWYYTGRGFKFQSGGTNYRINLAGPNATHWGQAARDGALWKAALNG